MRLAASGPSLQPVPKWFLRNCLGIFSEFSIALPENAPPPPPS